MNNLLDKSKFWEETKDESQKDYDDLKRELELIDKQMEQIEKDWKRAVKSGKNTVPYFNVMEMCLEKQKEIMIKLNKIDNMYGLSAEKMTPVHIKVKEMKNLIENEAKLDLLNDLLSNIKNDNLDEYERGYIQAIDDIVNDYPYPFNQACSSCLLEDNKSDTACELRRNYNFCWLDVIRESTGRTFKRARLKEGGFSLKNNSRITFIDENLDIEWGIR